jgi:hypothetical protein
VEIQLSVADRPAQSLLDDVPLGVRDAELVGAHGFHAAILAPGGARITVAGVGPPPNS